MNIAELFSEVKVGVTAVRTALSECGVDVSTMTLKDYGRSVKNLHTGYQVKLNEARSEYQRLLAEATSRSVVAFSATELTLLHVPTVHNGQPPLSAYPNLSTVVLTDTVSDDELTPLLFVSCDALQHVYIEHKTMAALYYDQRFPYGLTDMRVAFHCKDGVLYAGRTADSDDIPGVPQDAVPEVGYDGILHIRDTSVVLANDYSSNDMLTQVVSETNALTDIGPAVFENCPFVNRVDLQMTGDRLTIADRAFSSCPLLSLVELPAVPLTLGSGVFRGDASCYVKSEGGEITLAGRVGASAFLGAPEDVLSKYNSKVTLASGTVVEPVAFAFQDWDDVELELGDHVTLGSFAVTHLTSTVSESDIKSAALPSIDIAPAIQILPLQELETNDEIHPLAFGDCVYHDLDDRPIKKLDLSKRGGSSYRGFPSGILSHTPEVEELVFPDVGIGPFTLPYPVTGDFVMDAIAKLQGGETVAVPDSMSLENTNGLLNFTYHRKDHGVACYLTVANTNSGGDAGADMRISWISRRGQEVADIRNFCNLQSQFEAAASVTDEFWHRLIPSVFHAYTGADGISYIPHDASDKVRTMFPLVPPAPRTLWAGNPDAYNPQTFPIAVDFMTLIVKTTPFRDVTDVLISDAVGYDIRGGSLFPATAGAANSRLRSIFGQTRPSALIIPGEVGNVIDGFIPDVNINTEDNPYYTVSGVDLDISRSSRHVRGGDGALDHPIYTGSEVRVDRGIIREYNVVRDGETFVGYKPKSVLASMSPYMVEYLGNIPRMLRRSAKYSGVVASLVCRAQEYPYEHMLEGVPTIFRSLSVDQPDEEVPSASDQTASMRLARVQKNSSIFTGTRSVIQYSVHPCMSGEGNYWDWVDLFSGWNSDVSDKNSVLFGCRPVSHSVSVRLAADKTLREFINRQVVPQEGIRSYKVPTRVCSWEPGIFYFGGAGANTMPIVRRGKTSQYDKARDGLRLYPFADNFGVEVAQQWDKLATMRYRGLSPHETNFLCITALRNNKPGYTQKTYHPLIPTRPTLSWHVYGRGDANLPYEDVTHGIYLANGFGVPIGATLCHEISGRTCVTSRVYPGDMLTTLDPEASPLRKQPSGSRHKAVIPSPKTLSTDFPGVQDRVHQDYQSSSIRSQIDTTFPGENVWDVSDRREDQTYFFEMTPRYECDLRATCDLEPNLATLLQGMLKILTKRGLDSVDWLSQTNFDKYMSEPIRLFVQKMRESATGLQFPTSFEDTDSGYEDYRAIVSEVFPNGITDNTFLFEPVPRSLSGKHVASPGWLSINFMPELRQVDMPRVTTLSWFMFPCSDISLVSCGTGVVPFGSTVYNTRYAGHQKFPGPLGQDVLEATYRPYAFTREVSDVRSYEVAMKVKEPVGITKLITAPLSAVGMYAVYGNPLTETDLEIAAEATIDAFAFAYTTPRSITIRGASNNFARTAFDHCQCSNVSFPEAGTRVVKTRTNYPWGFPAGTKITCIDGVLTVE